MDDKLLSALAHGRTLQRTLQVFKVTTPAAGAQFSFTVPGDQVLHIRSVAAKLVTSAAVATRVVGITCTAPEGVVAVAPANVTQAASLTQTYAWTDEYGATPTSAPGGNVGAALPSLVVPAGWTIQSVASLFDAADQWSNVLVMAESVLSQPMGVAELRAMYELSERVNTSLAAEGGM